MITLRRRRRRRPVLSIAALGTRFTIETDGPAVLGAARALLSAFVETLPASRGKPIRYQVIEVPVPARGVRRWSLVRDGTRIATARRAISLVPWLEQDLFSLARRRATGRLFIHASAVGGRGRALLMPGAKGSGKTTLAAKAVQSGLVPFADDCAVIDSRTLTLEALPRAFRIKPRGQAVLTPWGARLRPFRTPGSGTLHVRAVRVALVRTPARVVAIVHPTYRPRATCRLQPLSRATSLLKLLAAAYPPAVPQAAAFRALAALVRASRSYRLIYGRARHATRELEHLVGRRGSSARPS